MQRRPRNLVPFRRTRSWARRRRLRFPSTPWLYVVLAAALVVVVPNVFQWNATGPSISGRARVIDGDTIEIGHRLIRLHGIDAPEAEQQCSGIAAGQQATHALRSLISSREVVCRARGEDRYGRTIGSCEAGGEDIESAMVRDGWAFAYTRYSMDNFDEEVGARFARRGIWAWRCQSPESYRHSRYDLR
jgi:endonuclease YncB( thermonuclease family)